MGRDRSFDVAVSGVAVRLPGAGSDLGRWWDDLVAGRVMTTRYDRRAMVDAGIPETLVDDPDFVPVRGHLADADRFDNALFRVSPRDAELLDPQHRLMLEVAWAALEDAASLPAAHGPTTGVFASGSGSGYLRAMLEGGPLDPPTLDQALHGTEPDFIASLIAYKLGLTGPAIAVQTACSSSLVGVHLAVQSLLNGDCDQALVVGAGISHPQAGYLHLAGGISSGSGRCRPFDAHADGVVPGSGVGCVVLRRLADAMDDGLAPYGVVLGTAVNNDGAAKAGYYAPSIEGQTAVIRAALRTADVAADSIGYLETHGTGTRVGDPIEWSAASAALRAEGAAPGSIPLGALKANVGHLDAAAGVVSLIKTLLVLRQGVVPPVAGFTALNPLLESDGSPLTVPAEARPWSGPEPRRAGISSFGVGGTNVHVVVEQAPPSPPTPRAGSGSRLILLSAADRNGLSRAAARLSEHLLAERPHVDDVSFTLAVGRASLPERLATCGRHAADIAALLLDERRSHRGRADSRGAPPVVFLFPGQGAQAPGMAQPFAALPGFSDALERVVAAFEPTLASRVHDALVEATFPEAELEATALAQPALFALELAAATALQGLGLAPAAVAGHSLGEITAACVAGVLTLDHAARFVTARGQAMQDCEPGRMLAVGCGEQEAAVLIADAGVALKIAAVNAPELVTVAGPPAAVESFRTWLGDRLFSRPLRTARAFHSALIEPALPPLRQALAGVRLASPTLPFATTVSGRILLPGADIRADLFVDAARRTVRFGDALAAVAALLPTAVVVEVGPGRQLSTLAEAAALHAVPLGFDRHSGSGDAVLSALGRLWAVGVPIDAEALCGGGRRIHLPTYPFDGPRWLAPEVQRRRPAPPSSTADEPRADEAAALDPATVVASLWAEVLGHTDMEDDADFFELGGDSLLVTILARKLKDALGVHVPLRELLSVQTLSRQTAVVLELLRTQPAPD